MVSEEKKSGKLFGGLFKMEKNQSMWRYKEIGMLMLGLCILSIAENAACLVMAIPFKLKIGAVVGLTGCACALYYMFKGYSKNAASAYKAFMVVMFVTFQFMTITINMKNDMIASVVSLAACLKAAFALSLALSNDMGEKLGKSMALAIAVITTVELVAAILLIPVSDLARGGSITIVAAALRSASNLFVAWMGYAMTLAKYKDKVERGTK